MKRLCRHTLAYVTLLAAFTTCDHTALSQENDPKHAVSIQPEAKSVLSDGLGQLAAATDFHVNIAVVLTAMEGDRPFESSREYSLEVQRPDRLRLDFTAQAGSPYGLRSYSLYVNEKNLTTIDMRRHKYSIEGKEKWAEGLSRDPGVRALLYMMFLDGESVVASLLSPNPYEALLEKAINVTYVGKERCTTEECHKIRIDGQEYSCDVWVSTSSNTLVRVDPDLSHTGAQALG